MCKVERPPEQAHKARCWLLGFMCFPSYSYSASGNLAPLAPVLRGEGLNGVDLSRSGSRQDFRPIRFNLKRQTLASYGYGGVAPQPACLEWRGLKPQSLRLSANPLQLETPNSCSFWLRWGGSPCPLAGWKQSFVGGTRRTTACRFPAQSPPAAAIRREGSGPARPS